MHESELGTPLYRRSEAVAVNGDFRRAITVAQCSVGVVRESSVITEVQRVHFCAKLAGVWAFGSSSTERGGAGPSTAESALRACCATATVPHACAGTEKATRSHQKIWAVPNGVAPPFSFPVGRYGEPAAARHAGAGGPGRHRRQGRAKCACEASDKQARPRATCQVHCGRVTETVETEN